MMMQNQFQWLQHVDRHIIIIIIIIIISYRFYAGYLHLYTWNKPCL